MTRRILQQQLTSLQPTGPLKIEPKRKPNQAKRVTKCLQPSKPISKRKIPSKRLSQRVAQHLDMAREDWTKIQRKHTLRQRIWKSIWKNTRVCIVLLLKRIGLIFSREIPIRSPITTLSCSTTIMSADKGQCSSNFAVPLWRVSSLETSHPMQGLM